MLSGHDNGLVQLDHAVRRLDVTRQTATQQPGFGTKFGVDFQGGSAGAAGTAQAPPWEKPEEFDVHSAQGEHPRRSGPWKVYDE